ncbi:mini-chromosome maintenance complex-binding [Lasius niger]|uniref:Mini-chromosome maintenance complex-binding protein n=1 Tax=Lasius niger TaxID=67767 RepID=A0A0J7P4E1_LASNI|nr:mini-chromosome maintenance complex-binding [Lasius niger]
MTSIEVRNWTTEYYVTNQLSCQQILENPDVLREIPLLNDLQLHDITDKQLVRFRGMVQDMYDPEYFFKRYEVKNTKTGESDIRCGMYMDAARCLSHEEISFDSNKNEHSERQTYIVMSIPGLNKWAKEQNKCTETNVQEFNSMTRNDNISKRSLDDTDFEKMDCSEPVTKKEKILIDNSDVNMSNDHSKVQNILSEEHILNFPIPIDEGKACIVKIYDGAALKLNQVIDIIVPRLHAIKLIEVTKSEIVNAPEIISKAQLIRGDLHIILSQLLFGDHLAADYLICHLLFTMYIGVLDETGLTTGELSVTGKENYKALSNLLMFHKLTYDFKYYTMEYETDIPILIFSDVKSFIPCPVQVILNVDAESENVYSQVIEAAHQYLNDETRLANIHQYLEVFRHTNFVFNEEISKTIQDDFVEMRSINKNISADNLYSLMVFARLMFLSYEQMTLDIECWKKTLQLEMERMCRLPHGG